MVFINYAENKVNCKIVYYGAGECGKTTNIKYIYNQLGSDIKSKLTTLNDTNNRTLFFDFLSVDLGKVKDFSTIFSLYTVPGQDELNTVRKMILNGADGIIFVVDSRKEKLEENIESFQNLIDNLKYHGKTINDIPIVLQYNKRDLNEVLSIDVLEKELNKDNLSYFESVATEGSGIFSPLKALSNLILTKLQ